MNVKSPNNLGFAQRFIRKLTVAARAEPKRAGVVGILAIVLTVLTARVILSRGGGPSRAGAAQAVESQQSGNGRSALESGEPILVLPVSSINARSRATEQKLRAWLAEPVRPISRNLFVVKLDYFPPDGSRSPQTLKTDADGEFWGRLEKSLMLQADQRGKRENLAANYTAAAGKMRLDSIMMGPTPKAMIDGKLVTEGEIAAGFRVLKIEPRRITIEREGIRLEIQMK